MLVWWDCEGVCPRGWAVVWWWAGLGAGACDKFISWYKIDSY